MSICQVKSDGLFIDWRASSKQNKAAESLKWLVQFHTTLSIRLTLYDDMNNCKRVWSNHEWVNGIFIYLFNN